MRYLLLLCLILLFCTVTTRAQKTPSYKQQPGTLLIRANPTGLADFFDNNLSFGLEYRLHSRWAIALDASWIFASQYISNIEHTTGFIIRPSVRRYYGRSRKFFTEAEFHYKQARYQVEDWIGRDVVNGVSSYQENTRFNFQKKVIGGHLKAGMQYRISRNYKWWMEVYAGVGLHYKEQGLHNEPNSTIDWGGENTGWNIMNHRRSSLWLPTLPLGFRFLYRVSKK